MCGPNAIKELEAMDFIFLSTYNGLSVEERTVFVSKFNPHFSEEWACINYVNLYAIFLFEIL